MILSLQVGTHPAWLYRNLKPETRSYPPIYPSKTRNPSHFDPLSFPRLVCDSHNNAIILSSSRHLVHIPPHPFVLFTGASARIILHIRTCISSPIHPSIDRMTLEFLPFLPSVPPSVHPRVLLAASPAIHSHLSVIPGLLQFIGPSGLPPFGNASHWVRPTPPPDAFHHSLRLYKVADRRCHAIPHHEPCCHIPS